MKTYTNFKATEKGVMAVVKENDEIVQEVIIEPDDEFMLADKASEHEGGEQELKNPLDISE